MWFVLFLLINPAGAAPAPQAAATIDRETISFGTIDRPSSDSISRLRAKLVSEAEHAIDRLVDQRIQSLATDSDTIHVPPRPVTDSDIRAYRGSKPEDFERPQANSAESRIARSEHSAIRYLLEQKARQDAKAETRRYRRQNHTVEIWVPEGVDLEHPLDNQVTVAKVDSVPIKAGKLERIAALRLYRLRGEIYLERRKNLDNAIDDHLLTRAARRRGRSKDRLLADLSDGVTVTDQEVQALIDEEQSQGRTVPRAARVRPYLEFRKRRARRQRLIDRLRANVKIEIFLNVPATPILTMVEGNAPSLGAAGGQRLIAYSNYRCRPCRATHQEINRLLAKNERVRIFFRHFITGYDPVAIEAAQISQCAARFGFFKPISDNLLGRAPPAFGQSWETQKSFHGLVRKHGINLSAWKQCLTAEETRDAIDLDIAHARELGFDQAPAFLAEGIPLTGMQSADSLKQALQQGAAK